MNLDVNVFMAPFVLAVAIIAVCSIGLGVVRGILRSSSPPEDD